MYKSTYNYKDLGRNKDVRNHELEGEMVEFENDLENDLENKNN